MAKLLPVVAAAAAAWLKSMLLVATPLTEGKTAFSLQISS